MVVTTLVILLVVEAVSIAYSIHTAPNVEEEESFIVSEDNRNT